MKIKSVLFLTIVISLVFKPDFSFAGYDYINISNPFLKKIPIAVPLFKAMSGNEKEILISREGADLLSETLIFTRYFKVLNREAYLEDSQKSGIVTSKVVFKNWTGIGSEFLITCGVLVKGGVVDFEFRLIDTYKETMIVGKRYKGRFSERRKIIRRFCSVVIERLTGNKGYFNSKIAFISTGSGNKEIYLCDFDGYEPRQWTKTRNITLSPAWSSNGKYIAYTSYKKGRPDLYIENLKEKRGVVVAKEGINITPDWVPGKFALAATLSFSGDPEIYMLPGNGKIIKRLTENWGIDVSPSFSPDGKKMAFVSKRSGTPQIYILDLNTWKTERLTFEGKYNTSPSWSPRGDKIAYSSMNNGKFDIYVIDIKSRTPVSLTNNAGNNETPSWSPDGSLIVFCSTRQGPPRIYVMTVYGTDQRRLLEIPGEQTNPKWSPRDIKY